MLENIVHLISYKLKVLFTQKKGDCEYGDEASENFFMKSDLLKREKVPFWKAGQIV